VSLGANVPDATTDTTPTTTLDTSLLNGLWETADPAAEFERIQISDTTQFVTAVDPGDGVMWEATVAVEGDTITIDCLQKKVEVSGRVTKLTAGELVIEGQGAYRKVLDP
jgi:hypothetical protein